MMWMVRDITNRPGVECCKAQWLNVADDGIDATRITFADVPRYASGVNAGKKNWPKRTDEATLIITTERFNKWVEAWEADGNCAGCNNTGEVFVSWHHIDGTTHRPCGKCERTALAPEPDRLFA